eukprot:7373752-Prymnesium_polylepis.1
MTVEAAHLPSCRLARARLAQGACSGAVVRRGAAGQALEADIGTATTGDGVGLARRTGEAGCVACAAGGRVVRARLARCVRLAQGGGAISSAVAARWAGVAGDGPHDLAEIAGWTRDAVAGAVCTLLIAVRPRAA